MIHIKLQNEPASFDKEVRKRGMKWLLLNKVDLDNPLSIDTSEVPPYWRSVLDEMRQIYRFCAYTNILIPPKEGSIDHFLPKKKHPRKIYEWDNYRLALNRVNALKNDFEDVLDPFKIKNGWFQLDVYTGTIYADPKLNQSKRLKVEQTIKRLRLNDYAQYRLRYIDYYFNGDISLILLKQEAPYIYYELGRQDLL